MLKKHFILFIAVAFIAKIEAQELLSPSFSYSHKKTSYITLKDGTEIEGKLKKVSTKKGLIKEIKIKDADGNKHELNPADINFMYLPASGLDKFSQALDKAYDAQKWKDEKMDSDLLKDGYVYFESTTVKLKKKELVLMMQLLNPSFSKKVKIYHDPYAKQTMSVGIGNVTVAGGHAKSYFIKVEGEEVAYKRKKKDYKKDFSALWGNCKKVKKEFKKVKWSDLVAHATTFTECE